MDQSARLTYRRAAAADLDELCRHWRRPEVRRYLWDGRELAREEAAAAVAAGAAAASIGGGVWRVSAAGGRFVGVCALLPLAPEVEAALRPAAPGATAELAPPLVELVYSLEPAEWGRGYAREAAAAAVAHAFSRGHGAVLAGADEANTASQRVLEAIGMAPLASFELPGVGPQRYYARRAG
ncbi:MAG: GNAT family N-acetyltransferase; N-acetyltransferase [Acidimicrobiales bacterium]